MSLPRRVVRFGLTLPIIGLALHACGDDTNTPPAAGTVQVTTVTSGQEPDPDGYTIQLDGGAATAIGSSATQSFPAVASGDHSVQLGGLAANCSVAEENPRTVTVAGGEVASVTFTVTCGPTTGGLSVTSSTTGAAPDPDGYVLSIDGAESGPLAVNATVSVSSLPAGVHTVALTGLSANCQMAGPNIRSVTVSPGTNAAVSYTITCAAVPAGAGSLRISTATSGGGADPDGYTFTLDGGTATPIAAAATSTLANLAPGSHTVRLGSLSSNCSVQGANPRPVSVSGGATASVSFAVTCTATTGTVQVKVTTSGTPADPDGYVAKLDGTADKPLAVNGTVSFTGVALGNHTVVLTELAENCSADGGPSRSAAVTAGQTSQVSFAVTCAGATGSIKVTAATTGDSPDPDGFSVSLDGGAGQAIVSNGSLMLPNVSPGDHSVALTGIAGNCTPAEANPATVTVTAGAEAPVTFTVTCASTGAMQWTPIAFPAGFTGGDLWASSASDIYVTGSSGGSGAIMHYDGQAWASQSYPDQGATQPFAVWGAAANDVYAAGGRFVWHNAGSGWVSSFADDDDQDEFYHLGGSSSQDVHVGGLHNTTGGSLGIIADKRASDWRMNESVIEDDGLIFDIAGLSPTDNWAVGTQVAHWEQPEGEHDIEHKILHYDGISWTLNHQIESFSNQPADGLLAIWPVAANSVFSVGFGGRILHYDGFVWASMTSPTSRNLLDLWGSSGSDLFAVGDDGILRYDGASWTRIDPTRGTRVWGAGSDVFVLTESGVLHGTRSAAQVVRR